MRLASSSRAVRCRRLPIAYRLLVARSDVAAAKQARSQSPRGSPRRSRWAGPLGRLNKGQELCFPILLKQHFCRKLFFCGRRLALFGVNCGASRRIHLPSPARPPGAAHRLPAHLCFSQFAVWYDAVDRGHRPSARSGHSAAIHAANAALIGKPEQGTVATMDKKAASSLPRWVDPWGTATH